MIVAPFGLGVVDGKPTLRYPEPKTETYGADGSLPVHVAMVQIVEEIALVLVLAAMAARGGNAQKLATAIMVAIVVAWAVGTLGKKG